jgi:hypothetical protein
MKCGHCQNPLQDSDERFYIGHWPRGQKSSKVKNYHPECFREFAGEEYANEVMGYILEDTSAAEDVFNEVVKHTSAGNVRWRYEAWKE